MSKFNSLMERFKAPKKEKMNELVERSASRNLSNFAGVFQVSPISETEMSSLETLLKKYKTEETEVSNDLKYLSTITAEIKAISNQAVILHGQRIKQVQHILKNYKDGAFSAWLLKTYGNRQTPYNFMQYYELYESLPKQLQKITAEMPRQAIYSLSSRSAPQEKKQEFIEEYHGETKAELLEKLRTAFPLAKQDKRNPNKAKTVIDHLKTTLKAMNDPLYKPSEEERQEIKQLINKIQTNLLHG